MTDDRTLGYAALLAGHPAVGPGRLARLLEEVGAEAAWEDVAGRRSADPIAVVAAHREAGVEILLRDHPSYPDRLRADVAAPAVLFVQGDLGALGDDRVAIVGTRRCTGAGAGVARELGHDLTQAGVAVVSGLALGIDGAAHRGVVDAGGRPVAVVGSGLDVVYPSRHRDLWDRVRTTGLLLSEAPLGARPVAWRFPARNRIIATLADVVVVVESHAAGGSMHTVHEADSRGIQVMAVPGSVRSPAAAGTNRLLADGSAPARDATDVLVALGLSAASRGAATSGAAADRRPEPDDSGRAVLDAFDWEPATLEHLAVRTGMPVPALALSLEALLEAGWIETSGGWYERVSA